MSNTMPNRSFALDKVTGRKQARGCLRRLDLVEDFVLNTPRCKEVRNTEASKNNNKMAKCAICHKNSSLIELSQKCRHHDAACRKCLHRIYVHDAQKSIDNYPIRCFHPECNQFIRTSQLQNQGVLGESEAKKHNDMIINSRKLSRSKQCSGIKVAVCSYCQSPNAHSKNLNRVKRIQCINCAGYFVARPHYNAGMKTVICPSYSCNTPRGIRGVPPQDLEIRCRKCYVTCVVTPYYATIHALDQMSSNLDRWCQHGWAKCPHCGILISKEGGCNEMVCGHCKCAFDWNHALKLKKRMARVPDNEIHLWC